MNMLMMAVAAVALAVTPNDEGVVGADDSASIQKAVDVAAERGVGRVTIPAFNVRTGRPGWTLARSILLPGDMTVVIDNAHLTLADDVYANFFRSANTWTDLGRTPAGELRNIRILGVGKAVLDGGKANDLNELTDDMEGRPHVRANVPVLMMNCRDIEVSGLVVKAHRYWGLCFCHCRYGKVSDIRFVAGYDRRNQDGINLRNGCREFVIENISGQTGDDMIALSAIDVPRPDKFNTIVEGASPDICNVRIRNVRGAAVCHPLVALRNHNGAKIYDVSIENVSDTPFADPCRGTEMKRYAMIRLGNGIYWSTRKSVLGEISNITMRNLDCRYSESCVCVNGTLKDSTVSGVHCSGPCAAVVTTRGPDWGGPGATMENVLVDNARIASDKPGAQVFDCSFLNAGDTVRGVTLRDCSVEEPDGYVRTVVRETVERDGPRPVRLASAQGLRWEEGTLVVDVAKTDAATAETEPFRLDGADPLLTWQVRCPEGTSARLEFAFAPDAHGRPGEWSAYRSYKRETVVKAAAGSWAKYRLALKAAKGTSPRVQLVYFGGQLHTRWAEPSVKASSFGFDPVDATRCLQRALDSGARRVTVDRQAGDWIVRPLFITNSNIEVTIEDGVTVRAMRGKFYGRNDSLFDICRGVSNVTLRGEGRATLRMNKADYLDPKQKYPFAEWRMGVNIVRARHVTVKNLTILSSGGDGVYVGGGAEDVLLEDLVCKDHNRQGISVTDARRLTVRRCVFDDTYGAAPQCGVDIEPNEERDFASEIVFEDCTFNGNAASGFDMYLGPLTAKSHPISVVYRRCVARGNRNAGITLMVGRPKGIVEKGSPRGTVRFEDCVVAGNGREALKLINHTCTGLDVSFSGCTFDARGGKADAALVFSNAQLYRDLGGLTFDNCRVIVDKGCPPCGFEAPEGIGIAGRLKGVLDVECEGARSRLDLEEFASRHVPHPELVSEFKSMLVDFAALPPPDPSAPKGLATPAIRNSFVFVQPVPAAGEYPVRFTARKLRNDGEGRPCAKVQLLDRVGTDLGTFDVPEGESTYVIRANGSNVYRFEVRQKNGSWTRVKTAAPGGALLADRPINLFGGRNVAFSIRVPKAAREVLVDVRPEEPASAELFNAAGVKVDDMPFRTQMKMLKAKREPTSEDEIWTLRFPQINEDLGIQVGGDAVPLLTIGK